MHFLIVKTSSIGDVIQCFGLVEYLKKRFPKSKIDWIVEKASADALRSHTGVDRVIVIDTKLWRKSPFKFRKKIGAACKEIREKKYDVLFDLQGNTKSGLLTQCARAQKKVGYSWCSAPEKPNCFSTNVQIYVEQKGSMRLRYLRLVQGYFGDECFSTTPTLKLKLTEEEENQLQHFSQLGFQTPRLMISFGSNWKNKRIPEKTLEEFLRLINDKFNPCFFFIHGNGKERQFADQLERIFSRNSHTIGKMSLALWQRFMWEVDGVIAMDSAGLHLCGTTPTPSFSLFGPSSALVYKPLGEQHRAFQGKCPYGQKFDKRCPILRTCETGACIRNVSATELFEQFQTFWMSVSKSMFASTT